MTAFSLALCRIERIAMCAAFCIVPYVSAATPVSPKTAGNNEP